MSSLSDADGLVRLRLYVAGDSPNSALALANLRSALKDHPGHHVSLEVIDVMRDPEAGVNDGIVATPVLVRVAPFPERRVLGNLRDRGMLLGVLGIPGAQSE